MTETAKKWKEWYKSLVGDEQKLDVVEQPAKPVVGEVIPGELILDANTVSPGSESVVSAHAGMLREEEIEDFTARMLREEEIEDFTTQQDGDSLMAKCNEEVKPVNESHLLEPGSFEKPSVERVTITQDGIRVGNMEIRIDSEHVKIVAPDSGPVVITAKLRTKARR